jgi:cyclic beta-1,2-glucan synthetase
MYTIQLFSSTLKALKTRKAALNSVERRPHLRAELFSLEQLTRHAHKLASLHGRTKEHSPNPLLAQLEFNEQQLKAFHHEVLQIQPGKRITSASEWLLDNFYLIEEQIQIARRHLPKGYSQELPTLLEGAAAGMPRVYDLVLEYISHVDAQIDSEPLRAFIAAYQSVRHLNLGELWAIPIMLRLGLIENLQRITTRLRQARKDYNLAKMWVDRLQAMAEKSPSLLVVVVAEMAKSDLPLSSAFVAEFSQRLSRYSPELHIARTWLEQWLLIHGLSIEQLVQIENQNQAAEQVSVSHSIVSLRLLNALNWKEFVENLSQVEAILRTDPAGVYAKMDFATRNRYRNSVEFFARHSPYSEADIAHKAIALTTENTQHKGTHDRRSHVGFYLIDKGRALLGQKVNVKWPWISKVEHGVLKSPLLFYTGGIVLTTLFGTGLFLGQIGLFDPPVWKWLLLGLFFAICASQLAVGFMNWLSMLLVKPRLLPRLDFKKGIAPECRTVVAVPTLLTSSQGIKNLLESLEIHHLANRDDYLHFALLTDFGDAHSENLPSDLALLTQVSEGVKHLNSKYQNDGPTRFFLCHRPRRWNASENIWMGYERKRGKLAEFNVLLRGDKQVYFSETVGDIEILQTVKYVITLDTDTQLPRDTARQLVGTMAHVLNHPVFDLKHGIVSEGYSILQPRMGVSLPSTQRSWFSRIFAGDAGIDPYTMQVSDVYQDVFQEGSFIGKGIYDIDAFQKALEGRFPENKILSHDLLEACHARSALVSDVELYEAYPSHYNVNMDRRHRWIRGDWQITQWILPRVPGSDARRIVNPLSRLSQWKIMDNLRRSLVPIALLCLLLGSWALLPEYGIQAVLLVLAMIILPGLLSLLFSSLSKSSDLLWGMHFQILAQKWGVQLSQSLLTLTFLPYDVFISLDAISRSLLRLWITHKRLLEWQTSSDSEQKRSIHLHSFYTSMWFAPVLALVAGLTFAIFEKPLLISLPFLLLWFFSPVLAWWISQPFEAATKAQLSPEQILFLRRTARKTWHFFETFVNAKENWLPPDNFQEIPAPIIASRTSPTNMGLALLANLAAHDFGYLSLAGLLQRSQAAITTMLQLERYRGHFYNWYETRTLKPLLPLYVSSVDSGNLAGHLLTLAAGLRELNEHRPFRLQNLTSLEDTVAVLKEFMPDNHRLNALSPLLKRVPVNLSAAFQLLLQVQEKISLITVEPSESSEKVQNWLLSLEANCQAQLDELLYLLPWLALPFFNATFQIQSLATDKELIAQLIKLEQPQSLSALAQLDQTLCPLIEVALQAYHRSLSSGQERKSELALAHKHLTELLTHLYTASENAQQYLIRLENLAQQSDEMALMDFGFLLDSDKNLFSIGFNASEHRNDASCYDLLASEARLCSYIAIALGQAPQDHWFAMSRLLVASRAKPLLVSWSGSMFEYLMPMLVMPNYENTLLDHTCKRAVKEQISYGNLRKVAWGISESAYNQTDLQMNYQYRAFGVPGLGLKRGLAEDLVIAPYSSVLALLVEPVLACENLQRLSQEGREGAYGFYEAIDYTPSRLPPGETSVMIRSFMAHHQGMSLLALDNLLQDNPMPRRFMACPALKATDLLLQERVPRTAARVFPQDLVRKTAFENGAEASGLMRVFTDPSPHTPKVHLLSNGRYHVMITSSGGGYSRWNELALTRWREDSTRDCWGSFVYLRDLATGDFWSTAYQPTLCKTKDYEAIFTQARAEFRHTYAGLSVHTEIAVSPEDDVEIRRITINNQTSLERKLEFTSYAEVVLAPPAAEAAHPAFSGLFVQTEFVPNSSVLLCTRRARSAEEEPPWMFQLLLLNEKNQSGISYETDRSQFIGRGRTLENPDAMHHSSDLSNTVGSVLDPILALRNSVTLLPDETITIDLIMGVSGSRKATLALVEKYQSVRMVERIFDLAWTHSQVTLHHLNASERDTQLFNDMASALIYADANRRASASLIRNNLRGQSGLWSYGISGDVPLVVLCIHEAEKLTLINQMLQAHAYWRLKGLVAELLILNADTSLYRQTLNEQITSLVASGSQAHMLDQAGGIFVRRLEQIPQEDRILLYTVARIVFDDEFGDLSNQLTKQRILPPQIPLLNPSKTWRADHEQIPEIRDLVFNNGWGGFTPDGQEYVITLKEGQMTPAPWINVLANETFGTIVSESGGAYTWFENAHEFRLTPWSNDPVQDTSGESLYIRDEETGYFWSPTPLPATGKTPYTIRHGFGYTVFEHSENDIVSELWVYVARDAAVKFLSLKLRNASGRKRRLSVTGYFEWVLGDLRAKNLLHIITEIDLKTGALLAHNDYNTEFPERIVFLDVNDITRTLTGDRQEFIGRNGTLTQPAALERTRLSGKVGAGLDPCGALQVNFELEAGQSRETTFRLGVGRNANEVHSLIQRFRKTEACTQALEGVWSYWNQTLGVINLDTPDPAVNLLANGWLLYQTISSRIWGRSGFYQSGGAYGFRDQLQDVMALVHTEPAITRSQLLRAAAHQFELGDVQHWWHPPVGRGVRTHFSDDYLWLPYVLCHYLAATNDQSLLSETIPWLEGRELNPEEESHYELPNQSEQKATLYQHAVKAIEYGLKFGVHGLPLMGCGDWNDGMNLVGNKGQGESVWLGFFLYDVLTKFAPVAQAQGDDDFAALCQSEALELQKNIESHGWDGEWYRRAYFDNGEVLGSHTNAECQIDSLPQSWAIISGAGDADRSQKAMNAVEKRLIKPESSLMQLFDPPFDHSDLNPGYIKGYIPGVRENGGQYTHAAIWSAMAFALMGENEKAWQLFDMLNPIHHGGTPEQIALYKVEPYVVAADVYTVAPHLGRGGWTWYTGSAGWMYQLLITTLLGIHLEGEQLHLKPRLPKHWPSCKIHYRFKQTVYHITFINAQDDADQINLLTLDGEPLPGQIISLTDDHKKHMVKMYLK